MLTISAFNALLKTLEEPPAHIIFVLATTEMHKIPATILSRCQKFEFKNISREQLVDRLKYIAQVENIDIDDEAAKKIALIAKGGLRDAIGILDQVSNYNMGKVRIEDVLDITSAVGDDEIISLYKMLLDGDSSGALVKYTEFLEAAKDTKLLLNDLVNLTRDMIIYKNTKNIDFCEYNLENVAEKLENIESERLYKNIEYLAEAESSIRFSTEYISYMQVCLIKMSSFSSIVPSNSEITSVGVDTGLITRLEERIARLEEKLARATSKATSNIVANEAIEKKVDVKETSVTAKETESNTVKVDTKFESVKPEKMIIPNKEKIKTVISQSNEKFTSYASSVFSRILQEAISSHGDIYDLFQEANLQYSSKEAAVLIFKDPQALFRLGSSDDYKKFIENRFQKFLGVKYQIFALQEEQHQALQILMKNEVLHDADEIVEEKSVQETNVKQTITEPVQEISNRQVEDEVVQEVKVNSVVAELVEDVGIKEIKTANVQEDNFESDEVIQVLTDVETSKNKEEKKTSKIETLFQDIIVEE